MSSPAAEALLPGVALFSTPDGGTALRDAGGELFSIALPESAMGRVRAALRARSPEPDAEVGELAAFRAAGYLGTRVHWPEHRRRVGLLATAPGGRTASWAQGIADGLVAAGAQPIQLGSIAEALDADLAAVCAAHDGPAPAEWASLDVLPERGVAWQRVSREGRHVLCEPIASGPGDVRHGDVRARRLAAAGSGHDHLAAYWQHGAHGSALTGAEHPDAAEWSLVTAFAVTDLAVWARGPRPRQGGFTSAALPPASRLRVLDLDTGTVSEHPVLPVPAVAR